MSDFRGRDEQFHELARWANTEHPFSLKFLTGQGGAGKSRLAGEFAQRLQNEGWAAGFVDLRKPDSFCLHNEGTLLVMDYPEENRPGVTELLRDLRALEQNVKLRVLFLTRQPIENWQPLIADCNALTLLDTVPLDLGGIAADAAYELFNSAQENAAEIYDIAPTPVSKEDLLAWVLREPENHRALFIVAAGVQSALHPEEDVFGYKGREVVDALVEREIANLRHIAENGKIKDKDVFARILTMAAIAEKIDVSFATELAPRKDLELGFASESNIADELEAGGILADGAVRAPKPDILAAAFTVKVLARNPKTAPEIIWAALSNDVSGGLERVGRLSFDAEFTLQMHEYRLGQWLAEALKNNVDRCALLVAFAAGVSPIGLLPAAIVICKELLKAPSKDEERAKLLNNLSIHLSNVGDTVGALEVIKEAVEMCRKLSEASPHRYLPELARSLNNLSNSLSDVGDKAGALEAIKEAVKIRRELSHASPQRYLPDLALSLNNLSNSLRDVGDKARALETAKESVEFYHQLSDTSSQRYLPELARSLHSLSNSLSDVGDTVGALEVIKEAVEKQRKLSVASPQRYLPDLGMSLNNLSNRLSDVGDTAGALEAIKEAVEVYRKLSVASPQRYLPDLAGSLNNLSNRLSDVGDTPGALQAIKEGVEIHRLLSTASPQRHLPDLVGSLNNLAGCLSDVGDTAGALQAIKEAVEVYRKLSVASPQRYLPDLASSLNNIARCLSDVGDTAGALEAIKEAVKIRRQLSDASPQRYLPDLAGSLNNLSNDLSDARDTDGALEAIKEAVEIRRKLSRANPRRYLPDLAGSLNNLSNHLSDVGDAAGAMEAIREAVEIRRKLSDASPQRYPPDLARSLGTLGTVLLGLGEHRKAQEAFSEGIEVVRPFAANFPGSPFEELLKALARNLERVRKAGQ
jgi:hypothetical protein